MYTDCQSSVSKPHCRYKESGLHAASKIDNAIDNSLSE